MKNVKKIMAAFLLLFNGSVSAASISWDLTTSSVGLNDVFTVNVVGSGFSNNVDGGGLNIAFDNSILNVVSVSINEAVWDFGGAGISTGTIDNGAGTVDGIMVNTFADVSGSFDVATVMFEAIGSGTSILSLSDYGLNPWASGGALINPDMINSSLTVISNVPVPAAVWLFGSGLVGLLGIAKRKSHV